MCPVSKVATLIGRPRDNGRDAAIRSAAVSLMEEVGYDRVTIDEISHRAKVSKATIYRRWKNKQQLITDVVADLKSHTIPLIDTGSFRGDLIELIVEHVNVLKGPEGALLMGLLTCSQRDPELAGLLQDCKPKMQDPQILEIQKRAMERKEVSKNANFELVAEAVSAILLQRLLVSHQSVNRKYIEQLVDGLLLPALR